ncbi:succinate dehydrogenase, hydrophobic membrane anchor protein [Candidatus Mesenet endosymbiont of Phosphuga atrata]|uniref:succinate dehydrogenase, hydrophobic membrane anchor protein n=1 Tax=Candidatus Mesenet endosymbiont of Phosphuga atrata TaxID=3066221 RepID=UPI0030D12FEF
MKNPVLHWWFQRLSAVVMLFLFPWFIYIFTHLFTIQDEQQIAHFILSHPLQVLIFFMLLFLVLWHAVLGVQVIFEDYVYNIKVRSLLNLSSKVISIITFLAVLVACTYFLYRNQY